MTPNLIFIKIDPYILLLLLFMNPMHNFKFLFVKQEKQVSS